MGDSIQDIFKKMINDGVLSEGEFSEFIQAINQKLEIKEGFCHRCGKEIIGRRKEKEDARAS